MSKVWIEKCISYDYAMVYEALRHAFSSSIGSEARSLGGRSILIKPNLLSGRKPEAGVTTHPSMVGTLIDILLDAGAKVAVGDSPAGAHKKVESVWVKTGIAEVCRRKDVPLINFEASGWVERSVDGRSYRISKAILDFDLIVSLPKLKTHILSLLTCAIKNTFGVVPGFLKSRYHVENPRPGNFSTVLVDIYSIVSPWLTVVDGIVAMEGNGPSSGQLKNLGIIVVGKDGVAVDSVVSKIIGLQPLDVPTTIEAYRRGLGEADISKITVFGESIESVSARDFKIPSNWHFKIIPGWLARRAARFYWVKPEINSNCTSCGLCRDVCSAGAIESKDGRFEIAREKCVSCLCCHEICGSGAIDLKKSLVARLVR